MIDLIPEIKKRCIRCGLPDTYPGIKFNNDTICNYCAYYDLFKHREEVIKLELKRGFIRLINKVKKENHDYHCVVAYSGGKDSTYLLHYLKKRFKLKILACTFDNGFVSQTALDNIYRITKALDIESRIIKPDFELLKEVFTYGLIEKIPYPQEISAMLSQVCSICIGMVIGSTLNLAIDLKIPLMFIGLTPGQYPLVSLENFSKVKSCIYLSDTVYRDDPLDVLKILSDPVRERFAGKINQYFFKSQYIQKGLFVPKILFPFHALLDYNEKEIIKEISKLGWVRPTDTDACSTNCLLNSVASYAFMKRYHYHPYIGELSFLVREGKMSREEALLAEEIDEDSYTLQNSLKQLNLKKNQIQI